MGGYGVRTVFLMVLMAGLLMVIGYAFGGTTWLIIFGVIAIAMNFFSFWKSDSIIRTAMGAQEVTPQQQPMLHRIVERAAVDAGLPKPKVYVVDTPVPNAFATGRSPNHAAVAATTGIMSILTERELAGVMAHELAHVKNRDTLWSTMVAMMASVVMLVAMLAKWSLMFALLFGGMGNNNSDGDGVGHIAAALVLAFVAPVIAGMIQMAVSRQREYGADEMGARQLARPARPRQRPDQAPGRQPGAAGAPRRRGDGDRRIRQSPLHRQPARRRPRQVVQQPPAHRRPRRAPPPTGPRNRPDFLAVGIDVSSARRQRQLWQALSLP